MRQSHIIIKHRKPANSEGSLLLIALIVLGVVTLSTIYLSLVLLSEIKSTRFADNAILSHYVAESASERALWRIKLSKELNNPALFTNLNLLVDQCAAEDGGNYGGVKCSGKCSNVLTNPCASDAQCAGGTCMLGDPERYYDITSAVVSSNDFTAYDIPRNSPVYTDIYDPTIEGGAGGSTGITQLNIDWYTGACTGIEGSAKLETTYTRIKSSDLSVSNPETKIDVCGCTGCDATTGLCKCDPTSSSGYSDQISSLSSDSFYRISFRSLDVPVKKLILTANAPLPSQVEVKSTGTYRESQTQVSLKTLWKDALSGIFNYVVFSEESLIKDTKDTVGQVYGSLCAYCNGGTILACSSNADCVASGGTTCNVVNPAPFCALESTGGESSVTPINQTDAGLCNVSCNGYTFCGDGTIQAPNGAGDGFNSGNEVCDAGPGNSDTAPDTCRKDCRNPYCGDGVRDNNVWLPLFYVEECDEGTDAENNDTCTTACKLTVCGDGIINNNPTNSLGVAEFCDDGGSNSCTGSGSCCSCTSRIP